MLGNSRRWKRRYESLLTQHATWLLIADDLYEAMQRNTHFCELYCRWCDAVQRYEEETQDVSTT